MMACRRRYMSSGIFPYVFNVDEKKEQYDVLLFFECPETT